MSNFRYLEHFRGPWEFELDSGFYCIKNDDLKIALNITPIVQEHNEKNLKITNQFQF